MRTFPAIAIILTVGVLFAGCLGGGGDGGEKEPVEKTETLQFSGSQDVLAQATPVETSASATISLNFENVIELTINITVDDGDADTETDIVGKVILNETGAGSNYTSSVNGGNTPMTKQITIKWDGTKYMGTNWLLFIPVTCNAGPDTWPGPLIWRGVPDYGFSYSLDVTYVYHEISEE